MVFRDQRVPYSDYSDYIKEEGATYVNAQTRRYETVYVTTIDSKKSYWIAKIFSKMMFDKNITKHDLESERGAVQTEIGNYKWMDKLNWILWMFFQDYLPQKENIYEQDFSLEKEKDLPAYYLDRINNQNFTMEDIMNHYHEYYYPANMVLKIVGNFDDKKMKKLILGTYGKIDITGTKKTIKPLENPSLSKKPYKEFKRTRDKNNGLVGAKYIFDNYKKHIILKAYLKNIATRLQQKLRNDLGQIYSLRSYGFGYRKAQVAGIYTILK